MKRYSHGLGKKLLNDKKYLRESFFTNANHLIGDHGNSKSS